MVERSANNPRRVLIVEDVKVFRNSLSNAFELRDIEVVAVDSLEAAKEALEQHTFTEVITDGLEGRWREVVDSAGELPVTLLTSTEEYEADAKESGIRFIIKDPNKDIMKELI